MADAPDGGKADDSSATPAQEILSKLTPLLRPDKRNEAERVVGMILHKSHSGPLPAPEDLAHYDVICPGAADRIISMAESNMDHRQTMERTLIKSEYGLRTRGQWLAIAALVAMLFVIAFAFWLGQPLAAGILGSATLIAITGMFLGREKEPQEPMPNPSPKKSGKHAGRRK